LRGRQIGFGLAKKIGGYLAAKDYEIVTLLTYTPNGGGIGWVVLIKNKK
tara:strand:- start:846 stop:992 length:147 start_codon:yes stop_codon:yes gene_type:complete